MLLATVPVGRVAYCVQGRPHIEVINYVVDDGTVLIRMAASDKSVAVERGGHFALEADRLDTVNGTGWNVTVIGPVAWITEPSAIQRALRLVHAWAPGEKLCFARISAEHVFGRRLREIAAPPAHP